MAGKPERIPALVKRCPKCRSLTLAFDAATGTLQCSECGFREQLPMFNSV